MNKAYVGHDHGLQYAGRHLLVDIWGAKHLTDPDRIKEIMVQAVADCGATLVNIELRKYSPNDGISGVAILLESHLSIHTWPEMDYAAIDVFVCGTTDPYLAIKALKEGFMPQTMQVVEVKRGIR